MTDLSYNTVMNVTMSWDKMKRVQNYMDRCGELIFDRLFELEPNTKMLFGFAADEAVKENPKFRMQSHRMVDMIDCAVSLLGPDLDPLKEDLLDLGKRHSDYGVKADYLPVMERSVMYAMEELLDKKFTKDERQSWQPVFHFLITHMKKGMK